MGVAWAEATPANFCEIELQRSREQVLNYFCYEILVLITYILEPLQIQHNAGFEVGRIFGFWGEFLLYLSLLDPSLCLLIYISSIPIWRD